MAKKCSLSLYQHILMISAVGLLLPSAVFSAIYRPDATPLSLISAVNTANQSTADDIIDLQGQIIVFDRDCNYYNMNDLGNTLDATECTAFNALPIIQYQPEAGGSSGRLSIINGDIERNEIVVDDAITNPFRLIEVESSANLTLFNITLRNGYAQPPALITSASDHSALWVGMDGNGGAINNQGNLDLQNCTISSNTADESGGAIYNDADAILAMQSTIISNNLAKNNTEANNEGGGGIFNATGGTIETITNSTITGNITKGHGAGINNWGDANHIFSSTISYNQCCSIEVLGEICGDPATGNGGGIYNHATASVLQITNSTIAWNMALYGGGIFNDSEGNAPMALKFPNKVPDEVGGVFLHNNTIARNNANEGGGGIYNTGNNTDMEKAIIEDLISNIIADNTTDAVNEGGYSPDVFNEGDITNNTHNLVGDNAGATSDFVNGDGNNNLVGTTAAPVNPRLGHLGYNGGFTSTMALLPDSPAINKGFNTYELLYDQRGIPFARVKCSRPDIGSYELERCYLFNEDSDEMCSDDVEA